jgi:hypothetical protein
MVWEWRRRLPERRVKGSRPLVAVRGAAVKDGTRVFNNLDGRLQPRATGLATVPTTDLPRFMKVIRFLCPVVCLVKLEVQFSKKGSKMVIEGESEMRLKPEKTDLEGN